jgi:IstB-like ATP binding protein
MPLAQALAGQLDAIGVVDDAIEDGGIPTLADASGPQSSRISSLTRARERRSLALTPNQARDLLEIVEDRYDKGSLIITSQVPVDRWHDLIGSSPIWPSPMGMRATPPSQANCGAKPARGNSPRLLQRAKITTPT